MVERIQDLNLPNAVVTRIIKDALPNGISIAKEARSAIARAASIFVIYLTSQTAVHAKKQNHKSLSSDNVLDALEEIEFESFGEPLRKALEEFREINKQKKDNKATQDASKLNNDIEEDVAEAEGGAVLMDGAQIEE